MGILKTGLCRWKYTRFVGDKAELSYTMSLKHWHRIKDNRFDVLYVCNRFKPSSKIFLLTVPRRYFFCGSFMIFLSCVCYVFVRVCLLLPCGHLLGKGWPLGSHLWCLIVSLLLSHWYPGSGVVLDCIDCWSLPSFLLCKNGENDVQNPEIGKQ